MGLGLSGLLGGPGGLDSVLSPSYLLSISKKQKLRRNVERDWSGVWAWGLFPRIHKNELEPGKIEVGMTESLNSNSFDLNSNDLNRK